MKLENYKMKSVLMLMVIGGLFSSCSFAALINGQNWTDTVVGYTSQIQNYGGTYMDSSTVSWVLGVSDADQNGNMYAFDAVDLDNVAGWRSAASQEIVVGFNTAITDVEGDDIVIRLFCGAKAKANVYASADNVNWTLIGNVAGSSGGTPGTPGNLYDASFDLSDVFFGDVYYIKVCGTTSGSGTGMFFDSFASVPEPATLVVLGLGAIACLRRKK
ncbi:MAG: PEP-CTERM sorting domain-containing protein [Phycisphaerae bacterium]|jgi:hypothetical protein